MMAKDFFHDMDQLAPGTWSKQGLIIRYGKHQNEYIEVGLYKEPISNDEYSGNYTLQVFNGDDVIFCRNIEEEGEEA